MGIYLLGTFEILEVVDKDTSKILLEGRPANLPLPCIYTDETRDKKPP